MPNADGSQHDHLFLIRGRRVGLDDVRRLRRHAFAMDPDGHLYVYDDGVFWVSHLEAESPRGRLIEDDSALPQSSWYHHKHCDCELCGRGGATAVRRERLH